MFIKIFENEELEGLNWVSSIEKESMVKNVEETVRYKQWINIVI